MKKTEYTDWKMSPYCWSCGWGQKPLMTEKPILIGRHCCPSCANMELSIKAIRWQRTIIGGGFLVGVRLHDMQVHGGSNGKPVLK